jgi:soluble lytic murein transglycosylase-like protein
MGWASGLAAGSAMGQDWLDTYHDSARKGGLSKVDEMKLEELRAEQAAGTNPDQGLATPPPVTGYKFGDQTFTVKPTPELVEAYRQEHRAKVTEQHGSAAEGLAMREKAVAQKAAAYKIIAETAYAQGTPEAMVNAYSLMNHGWDARTEKNADGTVKVWHYPEGQPDKAEMVYEGPSAGVSDWVMKNSNPELFNKFAYNDYLRENMAANKETRMATAEDRRNAQADALLQRRAAMVENAILREQDPNRLAQLMAERDNLNSQWAQMDKGGLHTGNSGGAGKLPGDNAKQWEPLVQKYTQGTRVPPELAMAVITHESAGDPTAQSPKNAGGVMQLIPATAERFGVKDRFNPEQNIQGGIKYLDWLIGHFDGDLEKVVAGYNAGEGAVDKYGGIPPFKETQSYVPKVLSTYNAMGGASNEGLYPGPQQSPRTPNTGLAGAAAAPGGNYLEQAKEAIAARRQPKELAEKPLTVEDYSKLYDTAYNAVSRNKAFGELSPESQQLAIEKQMESMRAHMRGLSGGGTGTGVPAAPTIDGAAKALAEKKKAEAAAKAETPKVGLSAAKELYQTKQAAPGVAAKEKSSKENQDKAWSVVKPFAYLDNKLRTGKSFRDPKASAAEAQAAITAISEQMDNLSPADQQRATEILARLYEFSPPK